MLLEIDLINSFVESVDGFFSTMMDCKVQHGKVSRFTGHPDPGGNISVFVQFSGTASGLFLLFVPESTTIQIASRFIGLKLVSIDELALGSLGEIANIIAGGGKAHLCSNGAPPIDMSIPEVYYAEKKQTANWAGAAWLRIPFTCDLGAFELLIAFNSIHDQ